MLKSLMLILAFMFTGFLCDAQRPKKAYPIYGDTIKIMTFDNQPSELEIHNSTDTCTGCVLTNIGGGKTAFIRDTTSGGGGSSTILVDTTLTLTGAAITVAIRHNLGSAPKSAEVQVNNQEGYTDKPIRFDATFVYIDYPVAPIGTINYTLLITPQSP